MRLPSVTSSFPLAKLVVLAAHESPKTAAAGAVRSGRSSASAYRSWGQGRSLSWRSEPGPSRPVAASPG
jgi:hypothetical protein